MPLSFETKAAEDAEVPDLVGVCLVQLTQLLGGGTAVRASGIGTGPFGDGRSASAGPRKLLCQACYRGDRCPTQQLHTLLTHV
eukprot:scaffold94464_cov42-Phaeocystis_antarctica.AAC.1